MDAFDRQQLDRLIASEGGPHVSIFLSPPSNPLDLRDDVIRVSNLHRDIHQRLSADWMRKSEADEFLQPLAELGRDSKFLRSRQHGVAIYLRAGVLHSYATRKPLTERFVIANRFYIRPMLTSLEEVGVFHVLTLSKKRVRLLSATPGEIAAVDLPALAESFEDTLLQMTTDRGAQVHSAGSGMTGKQGGVFHGQGGMPDAEKAEIIDYLRHVEDAVHAYQNQQPGPLVLAGVDYLTAIYQQTNRAAGLLPTTISGNVDHWSDDELLQHAVGIVRESLAQQRAADARRLRDPRQEGIVTDSEALLCAAYDGRIGTLFITDGATLDGSFYPDTRVLKDLHRPPTGQPGDASHDLIETAVLQTFKHGGDVQAISAEEMPVNAKMAAIVRY